MDFIDDEHGKRASGVEAQVASPPRPQSSRSVKSITFTEEDFAAMEKVLNDDKNQSLPPFWQSKESLPDNLFLSFLREYLFSEDKYRKDQGRNWEMFYRRNSANFFKDRSWLSREFGLDELCKVAAETESWKMIDIGCGVGNGIFPILKAYDNVEAYCFDVSQKAIEFLQQRFLSEKTQLKGRISKMGVWNLITDDHPTVCSKMTSEAAEKAENSPPDELESASTRPEAFTEFNEMDAGLLLFVLSAVPPENTVSVIKRIGKLIKPGGLLLFRDYGRYDQKEIRFASRSDAKLDDHFYVRQDGTLALYFDKDQLDLMMAEYGGFEIVSSNYITRQFMNRKTLQTLNRCWIQAVYRRKGGGPDEAVL